MIKLASSTALAVLLLSAPAFAQTAPAPADTPMATPAPTAPAAPATSGMVEYVPAQAEGQWLASNFIGETVRGTNDESIGEINDILVDKGGNVVAAVIGVGGFLGIGEKDVAVPFSALQVSNERDQVMITIAATREQLKNAPEFQDLDDQNSARVARESGNVANPSGGMPPAMTPPRPAAPAQ